MRWLELSVEAGDRVATSFEAIGDEVIAAMDAAGLRVRDRRDDGEWVSLALEHRP